MPIIKWTKEFSINHSELDEQHRKWVSIYNKAHDRMMDLSGDDFASTGIDALNEMKEYSDYHFAREEEIMAACGFPELEMHKKLHHVFFLEIEAMIEDMQSGNHVLNSEIIKRIENWLRQHILEEDRKLKKNMDQQSS